MDFDRTTIRIRPRQPWEALDLGVRMAMRWYGQLIGIWCIVTAPLFLVLFWLPPPYEMWCLILLWWLKPLFERPLLFVLSRTVFGDYPGTLEACKAFFSLAKIQTFASLTWRRFSPTRAMDLAVIQLEGLSGSRRRARLNVLHREDTAPVTALTIFGPHFEALLPLAALTVLDWLIPEALGSPLAWFWNDLESHSVAITTNVGIYIAYALVAPFYVAGGFAVYLNRRVRLEGWDIEIAFKKMLQKRDRRTTRERRIALPTQFTAALLLACACISLPMSSARAQTELDGEVKDTRVVNDPVDAQELISEIKRSDDFNRKITQRRIKRDASDNTRSRWNFSGFAAVAELLLWAGVALLVVIVLLYARRWLVDRPIIHREAQDRQLPKVMFGLDVQEESLPDALADEVLRLWREGKVRAAIALLYRASLAKLIGAGVDLRNADTEERCISKAQQAVASKRLSGLQVNHFKRVTTLWQRLAYGHLNPVTEEVTTLCEAWENTWNQTEDKAA